MRQSSGAGAWGTPGRVTRLCEVFQQARGLRGLLGKVQTHVLN